MTRDNFNTGSGSSDGRAPATEYHLSGKDDESMSMIGFGNENQDRHNAASQSKSPAENFGLHPVEGSVSLTSL